VSAEDKEFVDCNVVLDNQDDDYKSVLGSDNPEETREGSSQNTLEETQSFLSQPDDDLTEEMQDC